MGDVLIGEITNKISLVDTQKTNNIPQQFIKSLLGFVLFVKFEFTSFVLSMTNYRQLQKSGYFGRIVQKYLCGQRQ